MFIYLFIVCLLFVVLGYGTHFSFLYVGTPPKRQGVIVDTGSSHSAFPCADCKDCGKHLNPYFNPSQSTSAQVLKCGECCADVFVR